MMVQQRPFWSRKWLGALCRLLAAFGRLWRLGIATTPRCAAGYTYSAEHSDGGSLKRPRPSLKEAKAAFALGFRRGARLD